MIKGATTLDRHKAAGFRPSFLASLAFAAVALLPGTASAGQGKPASANPIPQGYIQNKGQWPDQVQFYTRSAGVDTWVKNDGIVYDFYTQSQPHWDRFHKGFTRSRSGHVLEMKFIGKNDSSQAQGVAAQDASVTFIDGDGSHRSGSFKEARISQLYSGVDLRVYKDGDFPRFDLLVGANVDTNKIKFTYGGASKISKMANGNLAIGTSLGDFKVGDLHAFQSQNGKQVAVSASFKQNADGTFGFNVGPHDPSKPLIIDPVVYSTLLGASGGDDVATAVTVDLKGQAYLTGFTETGTFPTTSGAYSRNVSGSDVFVTKFNVTATRLLFSTIITPSKNTASAVPNGIVLDSLGRACVAGYTDGSMPVTSNAFQKTYGGGPLDGFFLKLTADGSALDTLTYVGGSGDDELYGVGVDKFDNAYVAGLSDGTNYPVTVGAYQTKNKGGLDAVVTKILPSGALGYSTYIGGSGEDYALDFAVDQAGDAYLTGRTKSPSTSPYPTTPGAYLRSPHAGDAYVTKVNPDGKSLAYSTLLGGSNLDQGENIDIDPSGNAYVTGSTNSNDYPITPGAFGDTSNGGGHFATKVAIDGSTLVYSTLLNSGGAELGVAVDDQGFLYIAGYANGQTTGIATANPDQGAYAGPGDPLRIGDAVLQVLNDSGTALIYGTWWGGSEDDLAYGVAVDKSRNAYLVGATNSFTSSTSVGFPTTSGVFRASMPNDNPLASPPIANFDAFLTKFKVRSQPFLSSITVAPNSIVGTGTATGTVNLASPASTTGEAVQVTSSDPGTVRLVDSKGNVSGSIVVFVPGGSTSASFSIQTSDVVQVTTVSLTADLEGDQRQTAVTVAPWIQALSLAPYTVVGGNISTGRIDLAQPAPAGGMVLDIESSDAKKATPIDVTTGQPITSVTIAGGLNTVTFNIRTQGVDVPTDVTFLVRATSPTLAATKTQLLHITPAHLQSLIFSPNVVNGGVSTTGTVALDGQAGPTPITVKLSLGSGGASIVLPNPPTVTIPAFKSSVDFKVVTGVGTENNFRTIIATRSANESVSASVFIQKIEIVSVSPDFSSVVGGTVMKGHVTMSNAVAPGGFQVTVKSTNPTYVKLSAPGSTTLTDTITVTIPAGSVRSPDFTITTVVTKATQKSTLAVSRPGYTSKVAGVTVRPLTATLKLNPTRVIGGIQNSVGTITLNEAAPQNGFTFKMSSSATSVAVVPFTVTVPAGAKTANFDVTSKQVTAIKTATITGTINALPSEITFSGTLTVDPLGIFITFNPTSVTGGGTTKATIRLSAAATSDLKVSLSSSSPLAIPPSSVTFPAGTTTKVVDIPTVATRTDTAVTIRLTLPGGGTNSGKFLILAPRVASLTATPPVIIGGSPFNLKVTLNAAAASGGQPVSLSANNASVAVPSSVTVPGGSNSTTVQVQTSSVSADTNVTITGTQPSNHTVSTVITLQAPRVGSLTFTPSQVTGGGDVTGTVKISTAAPSGGLNVTLTADQAASGTPYVHFPSTVNIPQGSTQATFTVHTDPVSRTVSTQISATFGSNAQGAQASITLNPS